MERQKITDAVTAIIPFIQLNEDNSVTNEKISESVNKLKELFPQMMEGATQEDIDLIVWRIGNHFNVQIGGSVVLNNPDVERWLDAKKTDIDWDYYNAYKRLLQSQERPAKVINENEKIIDSILDLSGDPTIEGKWARKGLVMGNVQSGKTQNYIGLINKAVDAGYKIIILLGGHLNDLRKQTQERIDEGFIGRESQHLVRMGAANAARIGVGNIRSSELGVASYTSTANDFNRKLADTQVKLDNLNSPAIFTIKKNSSVMKNLSKWITDAHLLDENRKLDMPLLLIDDEADYASINSKAHIDETTTTNRLIREILSKFNKSTYIGYTATPFANIFIDPESSDEMIADDLFPKDFMIKIPVSEEYSGQDFFFNEAYFNDNNPQNSPGPFPVRIIDDHEETLPSKHNKHTQVGQLCPSLKEAIRVFIINVCVRMLRGDHKEHNTMLINMTHLNILQSQLTGHIEEYIENIINSISAFHGLGLKKGLENLDIKEISDTYKKRFNIDEKFSDIFNQLNRAANKIKVFGINNESDQVLDYSVYRGSGLAAIVIGGHKLSRGLTLEGLSVSYFARNSKAYDTLLQMCRWFGYRPNYKDLCKLYTTSDSVEWYCHISEVIRELYAELENMSLQGKTPSEFGLKVRDHPGSMIVTSRAKMNYAGDAVHSIDMWGQQIRRFRFKKENEFNDRAHKTTEDFISKIASETSAKKQQNSIIYSNVPHKTIANYIKEMGMIPDDFGDEALLNQIDNLAKENLPNFKVAIFNPKSIGTVLWEDKIVNPENLYSDFSLGPHDLLIAKRRVTTNGEIVFPQAGQLSGTDDEKIFLDDDQIKDVLGGRQRAFNNDYIRYKERDFPSLTIYAFNLGLLKPYPEGNLEEDEYTATIVHNKPSIGFTISFPLISNLRNKSPAEIRALNKKTAHSYKTNKVWEQMSLFVIDEDKDYVND